MDAFFHPKNYDLFPLFAVAIQLLFGTAMSGSCFILSALVNDIVPMLNKLLSLTHKLNLQQVNRKRRNKTITKYVIIDRLINICFDNNYQFDVMGLISILLVICFTVIPIGLTPIVLYMNIVVTYFIFLHISPAHSRSLFGSIIWFILRFIIVCLCIPEANSMFRNLAVIFIFMFSLSHKCIQCLCVNVKPYMKGYRALRILFIIANEFCSLLASV